MDDKNPALTVSPSSSERDQHQGETLREDRHANKRRNVILNRASTDLDRIVNEHDPDVHHLGNRVWDRLDQLACEIEALAALSTPEAVPVADKREGGDRHKVTREAVIDLMRGEISAAMDQTEYGTAHEEDPNFEAYVERVLRAALPFTRFADDPLAASLTTEPRS